MSANKDFVESMLDYTKYQAGCEAKGLVALSYAIYTNNKREYASLESSHAGPLTSARTSNLDNFLASPAAGCHSPLNSLPAHMATRAGMREKSLRNARSVSTRPRVAAPVPTVTVHMFLYAGPNWYQEKATELEKVNIKKVYMASRSVQLAVNLNIADTASHIRLAYSDLLDSDSEFVMLRCHGNAKKLVHYDYNDQVKYVDARRLQKSAGVVHLVPAKYLVVAPKENIDFWCHYCFGQAEHTYEDKKV
ncbi:hypothetical protein GHT06_011399 [Daphnia sinensis]|uniref:Uncharacterized protein n=1 Tax=Daphnia sinensis TaxID=1820382 RepID=A0AAD5L025_9CRUS|nr:hypothetical protein GHT06_011399 [Daphnia sinensis]